MYVILRADAAIYLPKCSEKNCEGRGSIAVNMYERAEIRSGKPKTEHCEFTCGHKHTITVEA